MIEAVRRVVNHRSIRIGELSRPIRCLCDGFDYHWRLAGDEADEPLQVLHDGDQQEFVGSPGEPAQAQASEAQMAFEMGEAHGPAGFSAARMPVPAGVLTCEDTVSC